MEVTINNKRRKILHTTEDTTKKVKTTESIRAENRNENKNKGLGCGLAPITQDAKMTSEDLSARKAHTLDFTLRPINSTPHLQNPSPKIQNATSTSLFQKTS